MFPVKIKRLTATAIIPTYGTEHAAGVDLYADIQQPKLVRPNEQVIVPTGIAMAIPPEKALLICPRSGLSAKSGITVHNGPGVIDADYRGEIGVILHNTSGMPFVVKPGDRIAQGVFIAAPQAHFFEVEELPETARGTGGFGSTGIGANAPIKLPVQPAAARAMEIA